MHFVDDMNWRDGFVLSSHAVTSSERNALARAASAGQLIRVMQGAYVRSVPPHDRAGDRYRRLVRARHLVSAEALVFSHTSAATLWRLPRIGPWPERTHVLSPGVKSRATKNHVSHVGTAVAPDRIDGVSVTPLARTIVDLARTESLTNAVVAADAALAGISFTNGTASVSRMMLLAEIDRVGEGRGSRLARYAIEFADSKAESPGESLSRLAIARARLGRPILQQCFADEEGEMYVDFWWPAHGVIGEFDGVGKYLRSEWMGGRSAAEVVIDEKKREDRLRRQVDVGTVVRWGWNTALAPIRLEALLRRAGVC